MCKGNASVYIIKLKYNFSNKLHTLNFKYNKEKEGMNLREKEEGQTNKTNGNYGYEVAKRSSCYGK